MLIWTLGRFCLAAFVAIGLSSGAARSQASLPSSGHIDLSEFTLTYSDEFYTLDVSPHGPGTRWTAHTPWNGDFGDAVFTDPGPAFPFTVRDGILRIEARKDANGRWRSGLLASANSAGIGFSQQYGYFEIRAKLPSGPGVWPAFWLSSIAGTAASSIEIDVFEHYGHFPASFHSVMHVWFTGSGNQSENHVQHVPSNSLSDEFNTYGVLVEPDWTRFFLNGLEYWRVRTPAEHNRPLLILLNLALGSGWPIDQTPDPSYMFVDYVRVYSKRQMEQTREQRATVECSQLGELKAVALCLAGKLIDADLEKCLRGECFGDDHELTRLLRNVTGRSGDPLGRCGNYEIRALPAGNVEFSRGKKWKLCTGSELVFQDDGNLVLYNGNRTPVWASGTENRQAVQLSLQSDGNLAIYNLNGEVVWSTTVPSTSGAILAVQEDGNVVIYGASGHPLWSTGG